MRVVGSAQKRYGMRMAPGDCIVAANPIAGQLVTCLTASPQEQSRWERELIRPVLVRTGRVVSAKVILAPQKTG
jgi:hypothetical protein